jgi:hypothetical protein
VFAAAIGEEDKGNALFFQKRQRLRCAGNGFGRTEEDAVNAKQGISYRESGRRLYV